MNTNKEVEKVIRDWLGDRVVEPRPRALTETLEYLITTPQRRRRWLGRWFGRRKGVMHGTPDRGSSTTDEKTKRNRLMMTTTGLAAGVAAVALAAVVITPGGSDGGAPIPGASVGATHVVAADGSGDFDSLADAVAAAADGDTLMVRPGTYPGSLTVDKDLTIVGDGDPGEIVIEWSSDGPTVTTDPGRPWEWTGPAGLLFIGSDAAVSGLTVRGPGEGISVYFDGGAPVVAGVIVDMGQRPDEQSDSRTAFYLTNDAQPTITGSSWDGYFAIRAGSGPTLQGNVITAHTVSADGPGETNLIENSFLDGASTSYSAAASGLIEGNDFTGGDIGIDSGSSATIRGNTIRGHSGQFGGGALRVSDNGSSAMISGNTVIDSGTAISVDAVAEATITDNILTGNDVAMTIRSDSAIERNTIHEGKVGIVISGASPVLTDNTIRGVSGRGLAIGGGHPILSGNTVCDNGENVWMAKDVDVDLSDNEVCP